MQPPYENLVPYFPLSYAAAAAQPPNLNKVATKEGPSGKWPPVDTGENTVLLKMCVSLGQNDQDGSMMTVTFKVLLSSELMLQNTRLGIVLGQPLSDWQEVRVEMSEEAPEAKIEDGRYRLMVGDLCFPKQLVGTIIPYKYVAVDPDGGAKFEYIHILGDAYRTANRCLIVPDGQVGFTKYDDVILCEGWDDLFERLSKGRFLATNYMLPRLAELANPQFDFAAALDKFGAVIRAHRSDGARICINDCSVNRFTSDPFYRGTSPINSYVGSLFKILRKAVNNNSCDGEKVLRSTVNNSNRAKGTLLRSAIYLCLIVASKLCSYQLSSEDQLLIFEAFFVCADELEEESVLLSSAEVKKQVCDALQQLVKKFVHQPLYQNAINDKKRGNWIAVIPFIHRWDPIRDSGWLDLTDWKRQNQFR